MVAFVVCVLNLINAYKIQFMYYTIANFKKKVNKKWGRWYQIFILPKIMSQCDTFSLYKICFMVFTVDFKLKYDLDISLKVL